MNNKISKPFPFSPMLAALIVAGAATTAHAAPAPLAATVMFVSGPVVIKPAKDDSNSVERVALKGGQLVSGETIETGAGRIQLRMVDGATLALQPDTTLALDDYHLAGDGKAEKGFLNLVKGGLRQVSGSIGHVRREDYKLETPMGLIGIRGTEFTVDMGKALTVAVVQGQVNVCSNGGCADVFPGQISTVPTISARPSVKTAAVQSVAPTQPVAQATMASSSAATYSGGEQVRSELQAPPPEPVANADEPSTSQTPPASGVSPAPAPAPAESPSPAPSPAPSASPSPSPSPAPAPSPAVAPPASTAPVPVSGTGTIGGVSANKDGKIDPIAASGVLTFDAAGGLSAFTDGKKGPKDKLSTGAAVDASFDNSIAWGRWESGQDKPGPAGEVKALHYFAFQGTPTLPVVGTFSAFASTAPTLTEDKKGGTSVVGLSNGVSGTLSVNFTGSSKGFVAYGLTVPANGNVFTLAGIAFQSDVFGFTGKGIVTSAQAANGCTPTCAGALSGGASVIGAVGGSAASRVGLTYGFKSTAGTVTGVVVFKP